MKSTKSEKSENFYLPKPRRGDVYQPMVQESGESGVRRKKFEVREVKELQPTQAPKGLNLSNPGIYPGASRSPHFFAASAVLDRGGNALCGTKRELFWKALKLKKFEVREVKELSPTQAPKGRCIPANGAALGNRELDGRDLKSKNCNQPKPRRS